MRMGILIIALLTTTASLSTAETIKIATLNWEPYVGESLQDYGAHGAIVKEAFKRVGKDVEFSFYPWKRAYYIALKGESFLISASENKERRQIFHYSDPYDNAASYLIGLKKNGYEFNGNLKDLASYRVGVLRGHYLVKLLQESGVETIEEVRTDNHNFKKLFSDRIDFMAMSKIPAIELLKKDPTIGGTLAEIIFYEPPLRENPIHLIGHKEMPESLEIISQFNKGLAQIKKDGIYDAIMKKYGFR